MRLEYGKVKSGFLEKLIGRLGRIGPEEVQHYLLRLAQEKGFLETIFNSIQEGIIVTDSNARITYVNDAACEIFGIDAENSIGKRLDERVRGLDWNSLSQSSGALSRDMEIFYPANRFINFYIVPLIIERRGDGDGKPNGAAEPVGHAMILRDITESRRSTQQTIESERFNALTLLAAGVAHEIGNPLNSLHIHLQLMERKIRELKGKQKAALQESIDVARSEISRLDSIVSQFLRAIRPSRPELHPENVNAIIEETLRFFAPEIKDRDIVVEEDLRPDLPALERDRGQKKQSV
jgi:two-component system, sporulation sensor kinase E